MPVHSSCQKVFRDDLTPFHQYRQNAILDATAALSRDASLILTSIGRYMPGNAQVKTRLSSSIACRAMTLYTAISRLFFIILPGFSPETLRCASLPLTGVVILLRYSMFCILPKFATGVLYYFWIRLYRHSGNKLLRSIRIFLIRLQSLLLRINRIKITFKHSTMTATRAYFVSMFILPPCEEGTTIQIVRVWSGSPRVDRNISWGFIFPDLRVNLKPESFRHPLLSYPSLAKWLFIYTANPVPDFSHYSFDQPKLSQFFSARPNRQNSSPPASSAATCHIAKVAKLLQ